MLSEYKLDKYWRYGWSRRIGAWSGRALNARSRRVALGEPSVALAKVWHNGGGQVCHPQAGPGVGHSPWVFLVDQCGHILTGTLGGGKEVLMEVKLSQREPRLSTDCPAPVSAAPVGFLNCPSLWVTLSVHLTNVY